LKNHGNNDKHLLEMRRITKTFPGVVVLDEVSLSLDAGEVLGLIGENGAGKSTLIKILSGAHMPDSGYILIDGKAANIHSPTSAIAAGVAVIYQEFNLVPHLTVRENVFLGREICKNGLIDISAERKRTDALLERIGASIDSETLCSQLSVAHQQCVEIAKAIDLDARIIVMDEPTAAITAKEVEHLFTIIADLKAQGIGIIYISHRLEEVERITDRVMVLRDGKNIGCSKTKDLPRPDMIELMVGRSMDAEFPTRYARIGKERLRVEKLNRGKQVKDVSFSVRAGEVLGFAGLVGAGRSETMRLIFGADKLQSGKIFMNDRQINIKKPSDAIKNHICLLTEDRKAQGLVLGHSVCENFGLPNIKQFSCGQFMNMKKEHQEFEKHVQSMQIKISSHDQLAGNLSGGNQQKVVIAKWLQSNAEVVIFDEPTRGIDVGAKYEIYLLINELCRSGKAVIVISSELPEVLGISDRIIVMHQGQVKAEIKDVKNTTQNDIMSAIFN
jgi:ribose transport system ATP-binding protein